MYAISDNTVNSNTATYTPGITQLLEKTTLVLPLTSAVAPITIGSVAHVWLPGSRFDSLSSLYLTLPPTVAGESVDYHPFGGLILVTLATTPTTITIVNINNAPVPIATPTITVNIQDGTSKLI
jgi:hypothetical protein